MTAQTAAKFRRRHVSFQLDEGGHPLDESLVVEAIRGLSPGIRVTAQPLEQRLDVWLDDEDAHLLLQITETIRAFGYHVVAGHFD